MPKACFQLPGLLTTIAIVLSACNMPVSNATSEVTVQAKQSATEDISIIELTATQTEVVPTGTPTVTPTETPTPEPSATATPEPPMAKVVRESNCRTGPGGPYELVAKYQVGQILEVAARDLGSSYLFVENPEKPEEQCYLLSQNITISGEI